MFIKVNNLCLTLFSRTQASFLKNVSSLADTINTMGNPFSDSSEDLLVLDTREILDAEVVNSIRKMEDLALVKAKGTSSSTADW